MADALLLATVLVAFGALVGYVRLCDRLVGPDDAVPPGGREPSDEEFAR